MATGQWSSPNEMSAFSNVWQLLMTNLYRGFPKVDTAGTDGRIALQQINWAK